jgi:hypothetical protein
MFMRQVLQSLRSGRADVLDVPCPSVRPGHVLVRTVRTLISAGTERMLVEFGKVGYTGKAMQQQDKLKLVSQKAKTDGYLATLESVLNKLDQPLPLGYYNVGMVAQVGAAVTACWYRVCGHDVVMASRQWLIVALASRTPVIDAVH